MCSMYQSELAVIQLARLQLVLVESANAKFTREKSKVRLQPTDRESRRNNAVLRDTSNALETMLGGIYRLL